MTQGPDRYHWILYHLEAMSYGRKKVDKKMAALSSDFHLVQADPEKLRQIISELKELLKWHVEFIEYHKQKATSHIPETEKTKWARERRDAENKSYETAFLTADELPGEKIGEDFKE